MTYIFPLNREAIETVLPHRDPMLFIDRVNAATETSISAHTFVDPDWSVFQGHFPELPVMPGVLLIETIAQAGALILGLKGVVPDGVFVGLTGVELAKFRRVVSPGDTLNVYVELTRERRGFYKFEGKIDVEDDIVAELKFAAAQMSL
ncbi:MAG: 3-hydroxyacyl-ACP dehydratase FabZ [Litorimonas sp.]